MPKINRSVLVPFSARQMYELVNDVASYKDFLPGCVGSRVIEFDGQTMLAQVDVKKAGIVKSFSTRNQLELNRCIKLNLENGPFRHLKGQWLFTELTSDACKVEFALDFEFSNLLTSMAFSKVFQELMVSMVTAFTDRAKVIYAN